MSQFAKRNSKKKRYRRAKGRGLTNRQKQQITSMITAPVEKKYYDVTFTAENMVGYSPQWYDLIAPAQGTEMDQLIGSSLNLISLQYRFTFEVADTTNYLRYLILQWHPDADNDAPNWTQVMQFPETGAILTLADIMSPYVLGRGGTNNFKVLVDEQFYLDADNPIQLVKGFINKGFRKNIEANGETQRGTNHLYLMLISDSTISPHPTMSGYTRARFTDS